MYSRMRDEPILTRDELDKASQPEPSSSQTVLPPGGQTVLPPGTQTVLPSGQPVIIIQYGSTKTDLTHYNSRAAVILGACQIVAGLLGILINGVSYGYHVWHMHVGYGIWSGIMVS